MSSPDSARTLLCVDDNATALDVRVALLEFHGYRVFSLTSELETLSFLDQQPVDAVILDYLMPDIKGDKLSLKIRERHPDLPIILISGAVDRPDSLGAAAAFVSKSAGPRRLLQVLSEQFETKSRSAA